MRFWLWSVPLMLVKSAVDWGYRVRDWLIVLEPFLLIFAVIQMIVGWWQSGAEVASAAAVLFLAWPAGTWLKMRHQTARLHADLSQLEATDIHEWGRKIEE